MFTSENIKGPCLLLEQGGEIRLLKGPSKALKNLAELEVLYASGRNKIAFLTPFCVARETGMAVQGNEDILVIKVDEESVVSLDEIQKSIQGAGLRLKREIKPTMTDLAFAKEVSKIQKDEIAEGNACQVVFSRKFEGLLEGASPLTPLLLFNRLLSQKGSYMTFLFSDGKGHYFVGASPERQLEIREGKVIKNPIAGTMLKGDQKDFQGRLLAFLQDPKEINELSQILDEELKIMAQLCPQGGKIQGPFLREAGAVVHTEYHLVGHAEKPAIESLKASFHAPTLVGSPLKSAFRIIAKREKESRRYYGGEMGILEKNGDLASAIVIRTAEILEDGRLIIQAGAGIVRDSVPQKEAEETRAKAAGLIGALKGDVKPTKIFLTPEILKKVKTSLVQRNQYFSSFHFEDQAEGIADPHAHNLKITIVNNEDNFAHMLAHMTRHMGYTTRVVDTFDYEISDGADITIVGPGPGDINDASNPRMKRLMEISRGLMESKKPFLGICLGLQAMAKTLGIPVRRQKIPTQGLQEEVEVFGRREKVGFYNSFSAVDGREKRIVILEREHCLGMQFHPESAMTQHGYAILKEALLRLAPSEKRMNNLDAFVEKTMEGKIEVDEQKRFLKNLNATGYAAEDIALLVKLFYKHMPQALDLPGALDVCGTGGSGLSRINTSTLSAFVLASCGVPVAKHGNKAASGRFGSFDLLEALGIHLEADKSKLESLYEKLGLAFIYAKSFHPAFKYFAQARQELQEKTIFNLLGPLLNPANPPFQIIGTSNPKDMKLVVEAAKLLGKKRALVLSGSDGLDELTLTGETAVMELKNGTIESYTLKPQDFGFEAVEFSQTQGGDPTFNAQVARTILTGNCKTAHLNLVLANAALALKFLGKVADCKEGVAVAQKALLSGKTQALFTAYLQLSRIPDILMKIAEDKRKEIETLKKRLPLGKIFKFLKKSDRDFKAAVSQKNSLNLIAEIKMGSPSAGEIYSGEYSVADIASLYEKSGADAISVLTDEKYFRGSMENLKIARRATKRIPLLMKDFIIDEYQIYLARHYGADAILLIAALLTEQQVNWFSSIAQALGMDVLLEVHDERELETALKSKVELIGINNRNLHTFEVDIKNFFKLYPLVPDSKIIVAESGYGPFNTSSIQGMANAVLVGTAIMQSDDMTREILTIKRPQKKFKPCGIRTLKDAQFCEEKGIEMVGLNFVPASQRRIDLKMARSISAHLRHIAKVGIFQDQPAEEVNRVAEEVGLDFVQLAGSESPEYCKKINRPIIKTIQPSDYDRIPAYSKVACMFIVDGEKPGSGVSCDYAGLKQIKINRPFLVAGGVDESNVNSILSDLPNASGVDVATGIETHGKTDCSKIDRIFKQVSLLRP